MRAKSTCRFLVVDDCNFIRTGLRLLLESRLKGAQVFEAATAAEGLALFHAQLPDVVILDVNLPDQSGLDILRMLRPLAPRVLFIVVTANMEKDYEVEALMCGADAFMLKPEGVTRLPDLLKPLLAARLSAPAQVQS